MQSVAHRHYDRVVEISSDNVVCNFFYRSICQNGNVGDGELSESAVPFLEQAHGQPPPGEIGACPLEPEMKNIGKLKALFVLRRAGLEIAAEHLGLSVAVLEVTGQDRCGAYRLKDANSGRVLVKK